MNSNQIPSLIGDNVYLVEHHSVLSVNKSMDDVVKNFSEAASFLGFDSEKVFKLSVCISEVCTNIIKYGKPEDGAKISLIADSHLLHIKVESVGPKYTMNLKFSDELLNESGRGLAIINAWCDKLSYCHKEGNNVVLMSFFRDV